MNEDLQKQLAEMLAKLAGAAEQGMAFAGDQIPPLVAEKILLGRVTSTVWLLVGAVLLYIGIGFTRRLWSWAHEEIDDEAVLVAILGTAASLAPGSATMLVAGEIALKAWFAPRLYIVEWLRGFL